MLSKILLFSALVLVALKLGLGTKFGLRERLREIGRMIDGLVNVLLVLIVVAYGVQLLLIALKH